MKWLKRINFVLKFDILEALRDGKNEIILKKALCFLIEINIVVLLVCFFSVFAFLRESLCFESWKIVKVM